jgi:hypothetical protein
MHIAGRMDRPVQWRGGRATVNSSRAVREAGHAGRGDLLVCDLGVCLRRRLRGRGDLLAEARGGARRHLAYCALARRLQRGRRKGWVRWRRLARRRVLRREQRIDIHTGGPLRCQTLDEQTMASLETRAPVPRCFCVCAAAAAGRCCAKAQLLRPTSMGRK